MKEIKGTTKMCALLGNPTEHSLSPSIHNTLAYMTATDMAYTTFCVEKEDLGDAVKGAYALGIVGMNVTVPHKQEVMQYLKGVDELAAAVGAVNTLVRQDGGYVGYNTDLPGFLKSVKEAGFDIRGRDVVILGAGGVARAIAFACAFEGAENIYILNRSVDKAFEIKTAVLDYFKEKKLRVYAYELKDSENIKAKDFLLVQTTNVGMHPNCDDIILKESVLYDNASFGFDVVYNPYETAFIKKMKSKGTKAINGLAMLLYQGIESYKLWYRDVQITKQMEFSSYRRLRDSFGATFESKGSERLNKKKSSGENIILVGFMGSGKTTLGKWVSKKSGRVLIDTDKEIENEQGMTISEIFEKYGEEGFRQIETEYLQNMIKNGVKNSVISVGGGTPLRAENRELLKRIGTVVYLRTSAEELYHRLKYDAKRPLLYGKENEERKEYIEQILNEREPAYIDSANIVVKTDGVYFPKIYQIIHRKMKEFSYKGYRKKNRTSIPVNKNNQKNEKRNNFKKKKGKKNNENSGYKRT